MNTLLQFWVLHWSSLISMIPKMLGACGETPAMMPVMVMVPLKAAGSEAISLTLNALLSQPESSNTNVMLTATSAAAMVYFFMSCPFVDEHVSCRTAIIGRTVDCRVKRWSERGQTASGGRSMAEIYPAGNILVR